jgi:hypothetical protein
VRPDFPRGESPTQRRIRAITYVRFGDDVPAVRWRAQLTCAAAGYPAEILTFRIQLRFRRASRSEDSSPSKWAGARAKEVGSIPSKVFTLTTAYKISSIALSTKGTTPQREHTWNSAVAVPNLYFETWDASCIVATTAASR